MTPPNLNTSILYSLINSTFPNQKNLSTEKIIPKYHFVHKQLYQHKKILIE